jgi:hypothetical protein
MSDAGRHSALFEQMPNDVRSLATIAAGLGIYDVVAKDFYDWARQAAAFVRRL